MNLISLLSSSNVGYYNKEIARMFGLNEAIILSELCSKYEYWKKENKLTENEFFFETQETIEENTTLSSYQQRNALKTLEDSKIIETKLMGVPAKKFFKIFENNLLNYLNPSCKETLELEVKKLNLNNIKNNNIKDNNNFLLNNKLFNKKENLENFDFNNTLFSNPTTVKKKENLYTKCYKDIVNYTQDKDIQEKLTNYLQCRIKMKNIGKPLNYHQWTLLLADLTNIAKTKEDKLKVIDQSIRNNWAKFVSFDNLKFKNNNNFNEQADMILKHKRANKLSSSNDVTF